MKVDQEFVAGKTLSDSSSRLAGRNGVYGARGGPDGQRKFGKRWWMGLKKGQGLLGRILATMSTLAALDPSADDMLRFRRLAKPQTRQTVREGRGVSSNGGEI